jgi:AcrR family transcriptional regulator
MVVTPWGDVSGGKGGGASPPPEGLGKRERVFAAMVASVEERGYEATTVADLLTLSGLSRQAFYDLFDSKADCFAATIDGLLKGAVAVIAESYRAEASWEERSRGALRAFLELAAAQPAAARLCLVEAYAAGEAGVKPVQVAIDRLGVLGRQALAGIAGRANIDPDLARAIIGGFHRVLYNRLEENRAEELPSLADPLWAWAMSYLPPPQPLRLRGRRPRLDGGGAPRFATADPAERIIRAFAAAVASKGYWATTIGDVAAEASISQRTLYEHFAGKKELLEAALDSSGAQLEAATLPAIRRSPGWPESARAGFGASCVFLGAEPEFAALRSVEVYAAGPEAIRQRDATGEAILAETLARGGPAEINPLVAEAIVGATYSVMHDRVREQGAESLLESPPFLTYVALVPFVGPEQACAIANGDGRRRASAD